MPTVELSVTEKLSAEKKHSTLLEKLLLILSLMLAIVLATILVSLVKVERHYDDCCFECNHLQTKLSRLQELSEYVLAMEQLLPSKALAELKAANAMIQHKKYREYERIEQSLLD